MNGKESGSNFLRKSFLYQRYLEVMPKGAGALFLIQIFSTLSFSVLYSTLILYATYGLHMPDLWATSVTGSFVALYYFLHLLGGYIGGRHMSYRSLFATSMVFQIIGCVLISKPDSSFLLWGLAIFLAGSGLNLTCINCMITQLFTPEDKRREAVFLWNYSGMNIGFFVGFTIGGYFHLQQAYQQLFLISALGNLTALLLGLWNWKLLCDRDTTFNDASSAEKKKQRLLGIGMVVLLALSLRLLLQHTNLCNQIILVIGIGTIFAIGFLSFKQPSAIERHKMWAFTILTVSSLIFWTLYQLAPMGLNLFIDRNVDRQLWGFIIAPQWVQNINTIVIIIGGPLLSFALMHWRHRGKEITLPAKFTLALFLIGIAFAMLPIGIRFANAQGLTNFNWILVSYVLQSVGELFISPIGFAMVGMLAPLRLRGLLMGTWMMVTGVAAILSDYFSKVALGPANITDPVITNPTYSHIFMVLGWVAIIMSVVLFFFIPTLLHFTKEKKGISA